MSNKKEQEEITKCLEKFANLISDNQQRYDKIISISDSVTRNFLNVFPGLSNKIVKIENMLPKKCIEAIAL